MRRNKAGPEIGVPGYRSWQQVACPGGVVMQAWASSLGSAGGTLSSKANAQGWSLSSERLACVRPQGQEAARTRARSAHPSPLFQAFSCLLPALFGYPALLPPHPRSGVPFIGQHLEGSLLMGCSVGFCQAISVPARQKEGQDWLGDSINADKDLEPFSVTGSRD